MSFQGVGDLASALQQITVCPWACHSTSLGLESLIRV